MAASDKEKKPNGTVITHTSAELFFNLPDDKAGALIKAVLHFSIDGIKDMPDDALLKPCYALLCKSIEDNTKLYREKCEKNAENARRRWIKEEPGEEKPQELPDTICK